MFLNKTITLRKFHDVPGSNVFYQMTQTSKEFKDPYLDIIDKIV